jgi:hypothetical protein
MVFLCAHPGVCVLPVRMALMPPRDLAEVVHPSGIIDERDMLQLLLESARVPDRCVVCAPCPAVV